MTAPMLGECLTQGWPHGCWATLLDSGVPGLGALVATFFGAWAALRFQERAAARKQKAREIEALQFAQVILGLQMSTLRNLVIQSLHEVRDSPRREFELKPISSSAPRVSVDLHSLSFALQAEDPGLLQEVYLANARYFSALDALHDRNLEHVAFQERYARLGARIVAVDPKTAAMLKDFTDALYAAVDAAVEQAPGVIERLSSFIRQRYPEAKVIEVQPVVPSEGEQTES